MRKPAPVRVAIIGTGGMANRHAECYRTVEGCKLVAGCDVDLARAKTYCEKHEIPNAFGKVSDLLEFGEFDAVSVVVPDAFHAEISIACLEAQKHVLCEKPLAINHAQALKMVA